jgi:hypothetical protein
MEKCIRACVRACVRVHDQATDSDAGRMAQNIIGRRILPEGAGSMYRERGGGGGGGGSERERERKRERGGLWLSRIKPLGTYCPPHPPTPLCKTISHLSSLSTLRRKRFDHWVKLPLCPPFLMYVCVCVCVHKEGRTNIYINGCPGVLPSLWPSCPRLHVPCIRASRRVGLILPCSRLHVGFDAHVNIRVISRRIRVLF